MNEPTWILKKVVVGLHSEQLVEHGGSDGIREEHLLDSALAKPLNVFAYTDDADIFTLAASYAFGIARKSCLYRWQQAYGGIRLHDFSATERLGDSG